MKNYRQFSAGYNLSKDISYKSQSLISLLSQFPENLYVVVKGYEGGIDDVIDVKQIGIVKNENEELYYGRHKIDDDSDVHAVFIIGENRRP